MIRTITILIVQLGWVAMLWEVPCEDVARPRPPRLSVWGQVLQEREGLLPHDVLIGHFWRGASWPRTSRGFYLEQWLDLGFQKGLSDWGAQNLDRFQPLLEGGRPLSGTGSGSDCPGSAKQIWGFRRASATGGPRTLTGSSHSWKGVGHSWQGVWLRLSGSAKQIWGFRRASATGGPRTLTGSSQS